MSYISYGKPIVNESIYADNAGNINDAMWRLINWSDVPLVMIWMSGAPPLITACRIADTRVSYEIRGRQSANIWHRRPFPFRACINYLETTSHYRIQLQVYILRKRQMFLVKYSITRLHTDLNCRYKCNLYYYIMKCVFFSCGSHNTLFVLQ